MLFAVERFNCKWPLYSATADCAHMRTEVEQKIAKQNNWTWLNVRGLLTIREHQNFLEEGKFIVGELL